LNKFFYNISHQIGLQILSKVFGWYFFVTVLVTTVHIFLHFSEVKEQLRQSLTQYGTIFSDSLAESVWNYDDAQIKNILKGFIKLDEVTLIILKDTDGKQVGAFEKNNSEERDVYLENTDEIIKEGSFFYETLKVNYADDGEVNYLGQLVIYSDDTIVFDRMKSELFVILINAMLKTLALWWIFLFISKKLLSRPLEKLSDAAVMVQRKELPETHLELPVDDNELKELTLAFNIMIDELKEYHEEMAAQIALKTKEYLEMAEEAKTADKSKSQFLAMMSHEIRTPMNGVLGMAQLLSESKLDETQEDCVHTIRSSGESLLVIINDILDYSKIEANKLELEMIHFDMRQLLFDVIKINSFGAKENQTSLDLNIQGDFPRHRYGDPGRLRQVLINLVSNAIKFTPQGEVNVKLHFEGDGFIKVEVIDSGIGLTDQQMKKLFTPFQQADSSTTRVFGGTGLGLAICKKLIDLMGGEIGVESLEGKGSTFWFSLNLPIYRQEKLSLDHQSPSALALNASKILWVESLESRGRGIEACDVSWKDNITYTEDLETAMQLYEKEDWDVLFISRYISDLTGFDLLESLAIDTEARPITVIHAVEGVLGDGLLGRGLGLNGYLSGEFKIDSIEEMFVKLLIRDDSSEMLTRFDLDSLNSSMAPKEEAKKLNVLVVDDHKVNLKVASKMISKRDHKVTTANSGQEAIEVTRYQVFDVIFMDMQMPVMDGLEATKYIREQDGPNTGVPIIALTANTSDEDQKRCKDAGMNNFVKKPLNMKELLAALNSIT